ncbi:Transmembrane protease serine 11D [Papilio machaon]|uniref:Transmembrane protease serine 11D n=1 Tax=Papilio machaon TaxID=76193 RepID=A0A194RJP2_PAPMA|nr:Transmembrane protease serine 11D [Papilio machaon]
MFNKPVKVMRTIKKILKHEKYNDQSMANDIALLYLERSLPLGKYIQRVTIRRWHSPNEIASVAGWGIVNRVTNKDTIHLKRALQKLISPRVCASFGGMFTGMMCAKSPEKNTSPASGDSGSALITKDMQQIGLVSYIFSEYPNMPIYTNVANEQTASWIRRNSEENVAHRHPQMQIRCLPLINGEEDAQKEDISPSYASPLPPNPLPRGLKLGLRYHTH